MGRSRAAEEAPESPETIVERYEAASRTQSEAMQSASMELDIQASVPKLKKHGRLQALRRISALGRITYEVLHFEGDGVIKNHVIEHYLAAEREAQSKQAALAVTPANYKFKFKGRGQLDGREVYLFQVKPRHKREGLFKGSLWIDASTYMGVRESGRLVKNPSRLWARNVQFVREYDIKDGISTPRQMQSSGEALGFGRVELTVNYSKISLDDQKHSTASEGNPQQ
ncbi:MAG TPA: hypothetical protein VME43_07740 [Bryobacteraceae bacterium]|nr:hypothetical protein [Bryobacteraceae bacterium]